MKTTVFFRMMLSVIFGVMSMSMGAQNLAVWDTPDNSNPAPPPASIWLTELAPSATLSDANVVITAMQRGEGLTNSGTVAGSSFGGYADKTTLQDAIDGNDFYTMTMAAKPGYTMSLTGIPTWRTRAASVDGTTGNGNDAFIYVQYALNNGTFKDAGFIEVTSTSGNNNNTLQNFSSQVQADLSNLTSATTVTFRFVVVVDVAKNVYIMTTGTASNPAAFVMKGTIVENVATVAQWNGYEQGTQPANGIFLATNGTNANNGVATLIRDEAGAISNTLTDGLAISRIWSTGSYWEATFCSLGYEDLKVTSKQQSPNSGPRDFELQYRVGSGAWNSVPGGSITVANNLTTGVLNNLSLPATMNNQESVSLRWSTTSDVSVNGGAIQPGTGTNRLDVTISGKIAPPALKEMTVKWNQAAINQADKTITATINSQANGFGNPDKSAVETYVTVSDDETTVTINGTTLDTALLPDQTGNFVDYSGGLTDIPVVLTNSTGTVTYYLTITDDTSTDINTIDTGEISARYYSVTGIEVPASTKGILIKRAVLGNGKIKTSKLFNK